MHRADAAQRARRALAAQDVIPQQAASAGEGSALRHLHQKITALRIQAARAFFSHF